MQWNGTIYLNRKKLRTLEQPNQRSYENVVVDANDDEDNNNVGH